MNPQSSEMSQERALWWAKFFLRQLRLKIGKKRRRRVTKQMLVERMLFDEMIKYVGIARCRLKDIGTNDEELGRLMPKYSKPIPPAEDD